MDTITQIKMGKNQIQANSCIAEWTSVSGYYTTELQWHKEQLKHI